MAYSLIQDILYRLNCKGISHNWETIRSCFNNRVRVTITAKTQDQKQIYLRGTTKADRDHLKIYDALDLSPEILKTTQILL